MQVMIRYAQKDPSQLDLDTLRQEINARREHATDFDARVVAKYEQDGEIHAFEVTINARDVDGFNYLYQHMRDPMYPDYHLTVARISIEPGETPKTEIDRLESFYANKGIEVLVNRREPVTTHAPKCG